MGTKPGVDGKERNSEGIEQGNEEREICGAGCVETATGRPGDGDQGSGAAPAAIRPAQPELSDARLLSMMTSGCQ